MSEFLSAPANLPFVTALYVMFGIAILEGVTTLLFGGLSHLLDALLPDFDLDVDVDLHVDVDVDADGSLHPSGGDIVSAGILTQTLSWMRVGQVPILILLVVFLTAFGLLGLLMQGVVGSVGLGMIPASIAWIPVLFPTLPAVRVVGGWIAKLIPKEETSAVSHTEFVGRVATIVLGTARRGEPTQARLTDEHGRTHYVMVEPDVDGQELESGSRVLLVKIDGSKFRAIPAPSGALIDADESS